MNSDTSGNWHVTSRHFTTPWASTTHRQYKSAFVAKAVCAWLFISDPARDHQVIHVSPSK